MFTWVFFWQLLGSESRLGQFLHGQLAELTIVNNDTESDHVIGCINSCREKIDFHAISEMDTGMVCSAVDSDNQHFLPLRFYQIEQIGNRSWFVDSAVFLFRNGNTFWLLKFGCNDVATFFFYGQEFETRLMSPTDVIMEKNKMCYKMWFKTSKL